MHTWGQNVKRMKSTSDPQEFHSDSSLLVTLRGQHRTFVRSLGPCAYWSTSTPKLGPCSLYCSLYLMFEAAWSFASIPFWPRICKAWQRDKHAHGTVISIQLSEVLNWSWAAHRKSINALKVALMWLRPVESREKLRISSPFCWRPATGNQMY